MAKLTSVTHKLRLGVLISGRGSNLQALIDACQDTGFPAEIAIVISNNPEAMGLERAQKAGIHTAVIPHTNYSSRQEFEQEIDMALKSAEVDLVCLAGFMRILSPWLISQWPSKIINIHPSLLPKFRGLDPQKQALAAGASVSGCTVHYVTEGVDEGPNIAQREVPVLSDDTEETLSDRILEAEHQIYPEAIRLIAKDFR